MSIWTEYYADNFYRNGQPKRGYELEFCHFCADHFDTLVSEIKQSSGRKLRISIPTRYEEGKPPSYASEIVRLFALADLIVVSPAPDRECQLVPDFRFFNLTSEGSLGIPSHSKSGIYVSMPPFACFVDLIRNGRKLFEQGQLAFLPIGNRGGLSAGWWLSEGLGLSPVEGMYGGSDPIKWQTDALARDIFVSHNLGCIPILPRVLRSPLELNSNRGTWANLAINSLKVPTLSGVSLQHLAVLREEEQPSFRAFQKSLDEAIILLRRELEIGGSPEVARKAIQKDLIDGPLNNLVARLKRLERFQSLKAAGLSVTAMSMLAASFFSENPSAVASAVGSVSLLTLFSEFIGMIADRKRLINDNPSSFLARLTLQ